MARNIRTCACDVWALTPFGLVSNSISGRAFVCWSNAKVVCHSRYIDCEGPTGPTYARNRSAPDLSSPSDSIVQVNGTIPTMSTSANASSSNIPYSKPTWEDDAWKIDSDDDEFVKASTPTSNNKGSRKEKGGSARHAPPARPHLFPSSASLSRSSSRSSYLEGSSPPKVKVTPSEPSKNGSSNNTATQSGWTLIERTGSGGAASGGGASPSSAAEVVERDSHNQADSSKRNGRGSEEDANEMATSIESDLQDVLRGEL
jgi:hypothetical protein